MREDSARSAELCARDNRYCEDAATLGRTCAVDVPFTWRCVAFESRFPKTHRPMRQGRMTIGTHTTPTSRSTDDIYQLPQPVLRRKPLHSPQTYFAMAFKPITGVCAAIGHIGQLQTGD